MECSCATKVKIEEEFPENVEIIITRTIFQCIKAGVLFWFRKFLQCIKKKGTVSEEKRVEDMDGRPGSVHTSQEDNQKL